MADLLSWWRKLLAKRRPPIDVTLGARVCEALGLDPGSVKSLRLCFEAGTPPRMPVANVSFVLREGDGRGLLEALGVEMRLVPRDEAFSIDALRAELVKLKALLDDGQGSESAAPPAAESSARIVDGDPDEVPPMTQQEIVDELQRIDADRYAIEEAAIDRAFGAQRALREPCGRVGHIFKPDRHAGVRTCVICGEREE